MAKNGGHEALEPAECINIFRLHNLDTRPRVFIPCHTASIDAFGHPGRPDMSVLE